MSDLDFELTSTLYLHVRGRQLEGTFSDDPDIGIWPISAARIIKGWGNASLAEWPYINEPSDWPPSEPEGIDSLAKTRRINFYQRIRFAEECGKAILSSIPVTASFDITNLWFNVPDGVISPPPSTEPIIGGHCVCILGVDCEKELLHFANSWGRSWGKNGFGTMTFEHFDRYMTEAWISSGYREKPPITDYSPGIQYLNWGKRTFTGSVFHAMEVYDYSQDERLGWAFAVERDGWIDVEELFVKPTFRSQGYGGHLLMMIDELRKHLRLPVRLWLSHADCAQSNRENMESLLARIGLSPQPSGVRWASGLAAEGDLIPPTDDAGVAPETPRVFNPKTGNRN